MAKIVIAGRCNCPYYAKAELVGDQLARNLPNFRVFKISKSAEEWDGWLKEICKKNSWKHTKSPIVWREMLDRGGKGMLIGDANDFQEYAKQYYGVSSTLTSEKLRLISKENEQTYKILEQERLEVLARIKPLHVTISHASSPVAYHIITDIVNGGIKGFERDIKIKLFEKEYSRELEGFQMEIEDLASMGLRNVTIVNDEESAFASADLIILLDELVNLNREKYELPKRVIAQYFNPYVELAKSIDKYAKETCKILISPLDSHSQIFGLVTVFVSNLSRINGKENVIGNSLYDELIAKSILAKRLRTTPHNIKDVVVIGQSLQENHYIDIAQATVTGYDGAIWARPPTHWRNLVDMVADLDWMQKEFPVLVHSREKNVRDSLNRNPLLTFSQSIVKTLQLWLNENNEDHMLHSGVVHGQGNYGVHDMCLSLPLIFHSGKYHFTEYFKLNEEVRKIIREIVTETKVNLAEKFQDDIYNELDPNTPVATPQPKDTETQAVFEEVEEKAQEKEAAPKERELRVEFADPPHEEMQEPSADLQEASLEQQIQQQVITEEPEE